MHAPRIDLFEWLLQNASHATYNLAFSNIHGVTVHEYKSIAEFPLPDSFELGSNAQYGASELKTTLCSMYTCTNDNVVTTTGASEANFLVFSSLLRKGDEFIIEQPAYQPMWLTPEMLGAQRIIWPRPFDQRFKVQIEALESLITKKTKLVVLTNLHNPSGMLMDQATMKEISRIATDHDIYVLVDEIFLQGSFSPQPSSFGLPNVIVTSSATKIYGLGGLHSGWIIAPEDVARLCQRTKAHTTGASSYTSEIMTAQILHVARNALRERFLKRAKTNLGYLEAWMNQHPEFFEWSKPDGGLMCFPRYTMNMPSVDLCKYLLKTQGVLINPGAYFDREGFVRVSYGCDTPMFQKGLDALEKGLRDLQTQR